MRVAPGYSELQVLGTVVPPLPAALVVPAHCPPAVSEPVGV